MRLPGKDEKSAAFLHTYEAGLEDDDQDFKHLNEDMAEHEEAAKKDDDDESDEENRHVSVAKLVKEVREVAQGRTVCPVNTLFASKFDVSFVDCRHS